MMRVGLTQRREAQQGCPITYGSSRRTSEIYDNEINLEIGWFWDSGIEVRLGDKMRGYLAEESLTSTAEIIPWFQEAFPSHIRVRIVG